MQTGQKISLLRKNAGMSQEELAEKLFVSRELVSKWETGKRNPDSRMISAISNLFGIPADELFDADENIFDEIAECFPESTVLSSEELSDILNAFLKKLSKTERTVFISRYYYRHSSEQTASMLGMRSGSVRKKLTDIRKKLALFAKEDRNG